MIMSNFALLQESYMNNDKCVEILSNFIDTQTAESDLQALLDSVVSYFSKGVMFRKPHEHNRHWRKDYIGGIGGLFLYAFYKRQVPCLFFFNLLRQRNIKMSKT